MSDAELEEFSKCILSQFHTFWSYLLPPSPGPLFPSSPHLKRMSFCFVLFCLWLTKFNLVEGCLCGHGRRASHRLTENSLVTSLKTMTSFLPSNSPYLPLATLGMAGPHEHLLSQGLDALGLSLVRSYGTLRGCMFLSAVALSRHDRLPILLHIIQLLCSLCPPSACSHMKHNFKFLDCLFSWVGDFIEDDDRGFFGSCS